MLKTCTFARGSGAGRILIFCVIWLENILLQAKFKLNETCLIHFSLNRFHSIPLRHIMTFSLRAK